VGIQGKQSTTGIRHQVDTAAAAVLLAKYGGGVCLGYDELLSKEVDSGQLEPVFSSYVDTVDSYYLSYNQNRPLTQAAQLFKDWLCRQLN
jgi:LysR family glycine cleavage system transcriptional activator